MDRGFNEAMDRGVWMAAIWRTEGEQPARHRDEAIAALPRGWVVVGPEDADAGCWLVIPPAGVASRLDDGREYHRAFRSGWSVSIEQP